MSRKRKLNWRKYARKENLVKVKKRYPSDKRCSTPEWHTLRAAVLVRDGFVCWLCGGLAGTVDHIIPASKGGLSVPENLAAACGHCNFSKGNRYEPAVMTINW